MSPSRFTRRQRKILVILGFGVLVVFGLLGYSVFATLRQPLPISASPLPASPAVSPLTTATMDSPTTSPMPTPTRVVPLSQIQNARAVREIGRIVAEVRDIAPLEQIPVSFPTEHEMTLFLLQQYQEEQPQQRLRLYATLGLVPPLDPPPLPDVAAQSAHISSWYLADGQQILLVAGRGPASPEDEQALVHSLAHALLDRQFDLESLAPCRDTIDATMALHALVEGDAVLTTARYAGLGTDEAALQELARAAGQAEEPTYGPLADDATFDRIRLFSHQHGVRLAASLYAQGDWAALDRAYGYPPCSTEQIMHPERYLSAEPVQDVILPDLGTVLGEDWTPVRRDTLGEFLIGLHLAQALEDDQAARAAADGWAGDTFALWESEEGEKLLAWRIVWDNRDEAAAFEQSYSLLVPRFRTPPLIATVPLSSLPGQLWTGPAGGAYMSRAGRMVTIIWGPDTDTVLAIAEAMP